MLLIEISSCSYHAYEYCVQCEAKTPGRRPEEPHLGAKQYGDTATSATQHRVSDHTCDDFSISWVRHGAQRAAIERQEADYENQCSNPHQLHTFKERT